MPFKPSSPKESLKDKIFEEIYPKPIIENRIIMQPEYSIGKLTIQKYN